MTDVSYMNWSLIIFQVPSLYLVLIAGLNTVVA